jgi:origin recognition complex subunit 6
VTTILTRPAPFLSNAANASTEDRKDKVPALIAAVYFFVTTRLRGMEMSSKDYIAQRKAVLDVLEKEKGLNGNKEGWEDVVSKDIDEWLMEISGRGWLRLDWFENVEEGSGLEIRRPDADGEEEEVDEPVEGRTATARRRMTNLEEPQRFTLLCGLGTMVKFFLADE